MKTVSSEQIGTNELSVTKWADARSDSGAAIWAAIGTAVEVLTNGWLGWGPDVAEPRWLVQVRDLRTEEVRTVKTTFTRLAAKHAAHRTRKILSSGDEGAIAGLPDYVYAVSLHR